MNTSLTVQSSPHAWPTYFLNVRFRTCVHAPPLSCSAAAASQRQILSAPQLDGQIQLLPAATNCATLPAPWIFSAVSFVDFPQHPKKLSKPNLASQPFPAAMRGFSSKNTIYVLVPPARIGHFIKSFEDADARDSELIKQRKPAGHKPYTVLHRVGALQEMACKDRPKKRRL